ncbi:hypothetical protein BJ875DRAFT_176752 [Amylocarpus encephaloides]|uniref:NmrA-like domain-containing protein n=1 Tax=Amylocarpus encephaloides TaxID=45428 RepID=A0A9P7Y9Y8_9HELO|nr:hypothetical protein BJ875DRAFT_176752 [Amylocarpus encephaloides]
MSDTPRIFVTGGSGYLGGSIVNELVAKHSNWNIVTLVRNDQQKKIMLDTYPKVEVVIGDLDNKEVLLAEASKADVILQVASSDHIPGVETIIEGASRRRPTPAYVIHVGGTGMLHEVPNGYGQPSEKVYHDMADLTEITSLPVEGHVHRDVDRAVLDAQKRFSVPTAIICPPLIHGVGTGPIKKRSIQIPYLTETFLKRGKGFSILEGKNIWDAVHIRDLVDAFILLAEEAVKPNGGDAQWGQKGYYFVEAQAFNWGAVAAAISKSLYDQGAIKSTQVDQLSVEDAVTQHPWAPLLWGGNCRSAADRLRRLGWKAKKGDIFASLPSMVAEEVKNLGAQNATLTFDH